MSSINNADQILTLAATRSAVQGLAYAGEVTPLEAAQLLQTGAKMIDVRYRFEFEYVGRVHGAALVEWKQWPNAAINPNFVAELEQKVSRDDIVLLLCRSGVRSRAAACIAAAAGFTKAYNIIGGFEGDPDASGKRSRVNGWRHAGLDWVQS